jgi:hypothetical protein
MPQNQSLLVGNEIETKSHGRKRFTSPRGVWPISFIGSSLVPSRRFCRTIGRFGGQIDLYAGDASASPFR